jgi:hypothetical protein
MRSTHLKTCAIAMAAALSMPAFSQGTTGTGSSPGSTGSTGAMSSSSDTTVRHENDRGFDWGWLGLLGLVGLMGLRKQPEVNRLNTTRTSAQRQPGL